MNYRELADACEAVLNNVGQESLIALLESFDRTTLVNMCQWNDPNGIHTDEKCMAEFGHTFPTYEYRQTLLNAFIETNHLFGGKDDSPKPYVTIYGKHVRVTCGEYSAYYTIEKKYGAVFVEAADAPQWVQEFLGKHWEVV